MRVSASRHINPDEHPTAHPTENEFIDDFVAYMDAATPVRETPFFLLRDLQFPVTLFSVVLFRSTLM